MARGRGLRPSSPLRSLTRAVKWHLTALCRKECNNKIKIKKAEIFERKD